MSAPAGEPDAVAQLLEFVAALRAAGLAVSPDRAQALLAAADALGVARLYWAGRLTVCGNPADIPRYDTAFVAHFGALPQPDGDGRRRAAGTPLRVGVPFGLTPPDATGRLERAPDDVAASASTMEILRHRDFAELSAPERAEIAALLALLAPAAPMRRGRRTRPAPRGGVDARRTLASALRHGGEVASLARRRRTERPRRLVLLLDVSGSMARYADALLRFGHAAVRCRPYHTEVFTAGTRLTRLTGALRPRDPERALAAAGAAIPDWRGGTRLGDSLLAFLSGYGHRGAARGAVVVIFSDGWERGSTDALARAAQRLSRLAYKLIWVSPHTARDGFAPTVAGLAAALPYLDALVAGHSAAALDELVDLIGARG